MESAKWRRPSTYVSYLLLGLMMVFLVFPVFWVFLTSLKNEVQVFTSPLIFWPRPAVLSNYAEVFADGQLLVFMKNSLVVAGSTLVISTIISIMAGYGFAKFPFRGSGALLGLFLLLRMIPGIMFFIPYFLMMTGAGLLNTHQAVIICSVPGAVLFSTWMLQGFFRTVPVEIEEAAEIDGLGVFARLMRIVLPISVPAVVTAMLFNFLASWNEYLMASTMLRSSELFTMPLGIKQFSAAVNNRTYWGKIMANATIYIIPVLVFTFVSQRGLVSGLSTGAVKA